MMSEGSDKSKGEKIDEDKLIVHDVFKLYSNERIRVMALRGIDFSSKQGEVIVIMGPSGAGKTTLAKLLIGIESVSSGSVHVFGENIELLNDDKRDRYRREFVSYLSQFPAQSLFLDMTVIENVLLFVELKGIKGVKERIMELISQLSLDKVMKTRVGVLSFGEAIRTALLLNFLNPSRLIVLDEPTAQLDMENTQRFIAALHSLKDENRIIVLLTHDFRLLSVADAVVFLRDGRISLKISKDKVVSEGRYLGMGIPESMAHRIQEQEFVFEEQLVDNVVFEAPLDSKRGLVLPYPVFKHLREPKIVFFQYVKDLDGFVIFSKEREDRDAKTVNEYNEREIDGKNEPENSSEILSSEVQEYWNKVLDIIQESEKKKWLVRLSGASKIYTKPYRKVFEDLFLELMEREVVFVIGPSGSGKSTLLRSLARIEELSSGTITYAFSSKVPKKYVAYASQELNFVPSLSIKENFQLAIGDTSSRIFQENKELLEKFQVINLWDKLPSELSGGELKRLSILLGMIRKPELLLLDEPTANLDLGLSQVVLTEVFKFFVREQCSIVIATHDLQYIPKGATIFEFMGSRLVKRVKAWT